MVGALTSMLNKPTKVKITGFLDEEFRSKIDSMDLQINPDSIKHTYDIKYNGSDGDDKKTELSKNMNTAAGAAGTSISYKTTPPVSMAFDFVFDATGVIFKPPGLMPLLIDVSDEVEKFKKIAYYYNGKKHEPGYVTLEWGSAFVGMKKEKKFKCRLKSLSINYTMFKPNGNPLRAELSATFAQFISEKLLLKANNRNSPDMTHVRTVQAGDNLPMMCEEVYGNNSHYLEVARINGMTSIFNLQPGTQIMFPPLAK